MPVSSPGSITAWLALLRAGDGTAAQPLWERYFHRLIVLARQRLRSAPRARADEEDVALSAFDSFVRGMEMGRFPQLADRDQLWGLLFVITERKAIDLIDRERRDKRGGGRVRHTCDLDGLPAPDPTPDQAAMIAEECGRLLAALDDATLRTVAVAKMEGYTNKEIAQRLDLSEPTIERKLRRIRKAWEKELAR